MKRLEVNQPRIPDVEDLLESYRGILASGTLTNNGPVVQAFERELAEFSGCRHALTTTSGTMALHLLLAAMDLPKGEVIIPAFTFVATASAVVLAGHVPICCDVEPDTLCIDIQAVQAAIGPETRAILGGPHLRHVL